MLNLGKSHVLTCANMGYKIKYFMRTYFIVDWVKQVYDFFVVELHKLGHDFKFGNVLACFLCFLDAVLDSAEKVLDGAGNDSNLFLGYLHVES